MMNRSSKEQHIIMNLECKQSPKHYVVDCCTVIFNLVVLIRRELFITTNVAGRARETFLMKESIKRNPRLYYRRLLCGFVKSSEPDTMAHHAMASLLREWIRFTTRLDDYGANSN